MYSLHLHLVPNIKDTQCARSNMVLKEVGEIKLVQMVSSKMNKWWWWWGL